MARAALVGAALVCALGAHDARAARPNPDVSLDFDTPPRLATLSSSDSCRASFSLPTDQRVQGLKVSQARFCLNRNLWIRWLDTPETDPRGAWSGRWKLYARPRNDLESEDSHTLKPIEARFMVRAGGTRASGSTASASPRAWTWERRIDRLRERLSERLAPLDPSGIFRSLLLAENTGRDSAALRAMGFVHLLAATGIHLVALALLADRVTFAAAGALRISIAAGLLLRAVATGGIWISAWAMCGFRWGMLRPWILVALRAAALRLGFRWRLWTPLIASLALETILACVSGSIADISSGWATRLSYGLAVAGGVALLEIRPKMRPRRDLIPHVKMALGSWAGVALVGAWNSGLIALGTAALSVVTIPLFALGIYPALLAFAAYEGIQQALGDGAPDPFLERVFSGGLHFACAIGNHAIEALSALTLSSGAIWTVGHAALGAGALLAASLLPARRSVTAALIACAIALGLRSGVSRIGTARGTTTIEQLDVGQGDAALVRDGPTGSLGLIDSGGPDALSSRQWLELFAQRGITHLDWALLTHLDMDHSGGLAVIARVLPVGCVATGEAEASSPRGVRYFAKLEAEGIARSPTAACIPFSTLSVSGGGRGQAARNANMTAIMIPFDGGGFYLSAGDAEAPDEIRFVNWLSRLESENPGLSLSPRILKVSHHGSRFSSIPAFLDGVRPTEAWISSGVGNSYGHPSVETLARIASRGIPIRRTDQEGAIRAVIGRRR